MPAARRRRSNWRRHPPGHNVASDEAHHASRNQMNDQRAVQLAAEIAPSNDQPLTSSAAVPIRAPATAMRTTQSVVGMACEGERGGYDAARSGSAASRTRMPAA